MASQNNKKGVGGNVDKPTIEPPASTPPCFLWKPRKELKGCVPLPDFVRESSQEKPFSKKSLSISNHNLVYGGGEVVFLPGFAYYKPHNYRLYFDFSKDNFSLLKPRLSEVCDYSSVKIINKSEIFIDNFAGCSFKVRKNTIEVINKKVPGRLFKLVLGDSDLMRAQARDILSLIDSEGVESLKLFVSQYGGFSSFEPYNRKAEHKFFGESGINRIPLRMVFQNELVKKVYKEKELEFFNEEQALNYFSNRAFEDVAPQVAQEIRSLKESLAGLIPLRSAELSFLFANIRSKSDVLGFEAQIKVLSVSDKAELTEWLFASDCGACKLG